MSDYIFAKWNNSSTKQYFGQIFEIIQKYQSFRKEIRQSLLHTINLSFDEESKFGMEYRVFFSVK